MKTLLLLRHAKSGWNDPTLADHDRPLNARGLHDAPGIGRLILGESLQPDLVISSTAVRARTTAALVAESMGYARAIEIHRALYHASPAEIADVVQQLFVDAETLLLVGHNPGLEELVGCLTGNVCTMPTAALAQIACPIESWGEFRPDLEAVLVNFWRPRDIAED